MDLLEITATSLACPTGFMSFINVRDKKRKEKTKSQTETQFEESNLSTPQIIQTSYTRSAILVDVSCNTVIAAMKYFGGSLF